MKRMLSGKRHQYLAAISILLIFSVTVALTVGMIGCGGEEEEEEFEIHIQDWYHLDAVRNKLDADYVCILGNDLDRNTAGWNETASPTANGGKGWKPIGDERNAFKGTFDGNGHTISDLFIDRPDEDEVGLFGYIEKAKLKNIKILGANVIGRENVGVVVGDNQGTVENCSSSGNVSGIVSTGGLAGYTGGYGRVSSKVRYCESTANVCGEEWRTGGLVGYNALGGYLEESVFAGNVTGRYQVGGLAGLNNKEVTKSVVKMTANVIGVSAVGGWVGESTLLSVVDECDFYGDISFTGPYVCCDELFSEGSVVTSLSVDSYETGWYVGGGLGINRGTLSNSYSTGSVNGTEYVGGLVGYNAKEGTVSNSDSAADVEGTGIYVGYLVGWNEGIVSDSYVRSTYELICDVPEVIVAGEETMIPLTLKTDQLGESGYNGVQLHFEVYPRAGDVTIKFDSWSFTNELYSQEYDLPADYNQTIYPTVYCSEPGEYTFTFSLIEALYGPVINDMTESITVSVVEA